MEHLTERTIYMPKRLGFHYFPDAEHYSQKHLDQWLPVIQEMGINWLVLYSPITHAIPENFIGSLVDSGIKVVVDFQHPLVSDPDWSGLDVILSAYGRWGVSYSVLDRNINMKDSWGDSRWGNADLVPFYSRRWLRFAEIALNHAVHPVLSPLVPGGDYWDTAFLKILLSEIALDTSESIISHLTLSAYGWDFGRGLDWGTGGPSVWTNSLPYKVPDQQNQNEQGEGEQQSEQSSDH